ncbi:hypothetical protein AYX22_02420 [Arthrobacter sp. D5-1]|nr:hypothetical protein AYX22_02420 [Arthrobacter sp. D5-1]
MNRNAAEKGNGAVRGSTTWALNMCVDLRKRDAAFGEILDRGCLAFSASPKILTTEQQRFQERHHISVDPPTYQ